MITQERFIPACWLIVIASFLDGLDGLAARLVRQSTLFGAEMDSFSDAISFGLAPGVLIYHAVLRPLGIIGLLLAFLPVMIGVIRLTRFNLMTSKPKRCFIGLPIPATALILAGFYLYANTLNDGVVTAYVYLSLIPALSLLMISPIPYRRLPVVPIRNSRYPFLSIGVIVLASSAMIWNPALALFPLMMIYLLTGPIEWGFRLLRRVSVSQDDEELPDPTFLQNDDETPPRRRSR